MSNTTHHPKSFPSDPILPPPIPAQRLVIDDVTASSFDRADWSPSAGRWAWPGREGLLHNRKKERKENPPATVESSQPDGGQPDGYGDDTFGIQHARDVQILFGHVEGQVEVLQRVVLRDKRNGIRKTGWVHDRKTKPSGWSEPSSFACCCCVPWTVRGSWGSGPDGDGGSARRRPDRP